MNKHGVYQRLYDAAQRFIWKVDNGFARSTETYGQLKEAVGIIDAFETLVSKGITPEQYKEAYEAEGETE